MQIVDTTLRAIIERVTEVHGVIDGDPTRVYVFEHLDRQGLPAKTWIQNWHTDDVTSQFTSKEREDIYSVVEEHYKCKATQHIKVY